MKKIMLVDDEPSVLDLVGIVLRINKFEAILVESGYECLEKLKEEKPDLILLDIMMEGMNGWDVIRKMKEESFFDKIPVAIFSAKVEEENQERAKKEGTVAFIKKPFKSEDFIARIDDIFKNSDS